MIEHCVFSQTSFRPSGYTQAIFDWLVNERLCYRDEKGTNLPPYVKILLHSQGQPRIFTLRTHKMQTQQLCEYPEPGLYHYFS
jgi:hypothetical protein